LEHINNKKLIERLDEFLNYPEFDPHGDPIPDSKGKMKKSNKISLSQLPLNKLAEVCQVTNQTNDMLELLKHKNISLGSKVEVKKRFDFDNTYEVKLKSSTITISEHLANNIFVLYEQSI
ncbi:MAG TPA: metal-dependent transcriptional regulator, partial [Flavisolibacter sp.]|nr:metal-dependent transcriptional regulator [Flavisolibacter sp.]